MTRRPSRTPIGLGRSAPRFGGSGPCIVKLEQQLHFAFLTSKRILISVFCHKIIYVVDTQAGGLWHLMGLLTVLLPLRNVGTHKRERCVDRCTRSKSTGPNRSPKDPRWQSIDGR
jgi:hypothetical protein